MGYVEDLHSTASLRSAQDKEKTVKKIASSNL